jgi:hypothetical protein
LLNVKALAQERGRNAILIVVGAGAAVSGKVGAWESGRVVLRRLVDERKRDKVDAGRAVLSERLEANLAPVGVDETKGSDRHDGCGY